MTTEEIVQKSIDELAVMINRSFNIVFDKLNVLDARVSSIEKDVAILKEDVSILKTDVAMLKTQVTHINKRLDLIETNMVSQYEFKSLGLRTDTLELALKA